MFQLSCGILNLFNKGKDKTVNLCHFPIGQKANELCDIISKLQTSSQEEKQKQPLNNSNEFENDNEKSCLSNLIVFDRELDPVTPLLTQLTYTGLIDECYPEGIDESCLYLLKLNDFII